MKLTTTVVGSFPKPDYLKVPDWLSAEQENLDVVKQFNVVKKLFSAHELDEQTARATKEVTHFQSNCGIDIGTDGEMRRENYIYSLCRNLNGFDFENPKTSQYRNGNWVDKLPRIVSSISLKSAKERSDPRNEWQFAQDLSDIPLKFTLPGPMTIADSMVNEFYKDEESLCDDLVQCISHAVCGLVEQGCKYIQIDEPLMVRYPEKALQYGIRNLDRCFEGVPQDVKRIVHVCCGYPHYLDQTGYGKSKQEAYLMIAAELDQSRIDQISIEDAHRRNNKELFQKLKNKTIILGVISIANSRVETVDEIRTHIREVLQYVPRERLIIAPDCGLIMLPDEILTKKLMNMVEAAKSV